MQVLVNALTRQTVCPVDATIELNFLVQDGEIKANATMRYIKAGSGLGLQFKAIRSDDQGRFAEMVKRLLQAEIPANLPPRLSNNYMTEQVNRNTH